MIRKMTRGDLLSVKSLMQSLPDFWRDTWNDETLGRALAASGDLAFVFEDGRRIVGLLLCNDMGFRAYLNTLAVAEDMQVRGIGRSLLEHVEGILKERRCELMISDVWVDAEPFYRKQGWSEPQSVLLRKWLRKV